MNKDHNVNQYAGAKLHALRITQGISQATLGREIGVTGQQVQKYESGANRLSIDKLYALAKIFEVSTIVFFPMENAEHGDNALPPASARLIRLMNKISEEHHDSLYAILRELLRMIHKADELESQS